MGSRRCHFQFYVLTSAFHPLRTITPSDIDLITQIMARYKEEADVSFEGDEETILKDYILTNEPDILNSTNQRWVSAALRGHD